MARQWTLPGYGAIDEDGSEEYTLPGYGAFQEDQAAVVLDQEGFRFRNDDGSESAATWRQLQDVNDTISPDTNFRLRTLVNATGDPPTSAFQLEHRKVGAATFIKIEPELL